VLGAHFVVGLRLLGVYLTCAFDPHGEGDHHAVLYDHFPSPDAGALWTAWDFLDHPGPHSWEAGQG
jgi:hypothetical protein